MPATTANTARYTSHYSGFTFLGHVPRTGRAWFMQACHEAGLKRLEQPPQRQLTVSIVRHPCDWLASHYAWAGYRPHVMPFDEFVARMLAKGGVYKNLFEPVGAEAWLRLEDFPYCAIELLATVGGNTQHIARLPRSNVATVPPPKMHAQLRANVLECDAEMLQLFNYGTQGTM